MSSILSKEKMKQMSAQSHAHPSRNLVNFCKKDTESFAPSFFLSDSVLR